ncbi:DDE-type integrase/transposase/recombinase [Ruminococcus bicirculans (ex Wegman et al. 2014)]|uniref:DDE-type integrase/transposase/recombinase n=1 Tax=Ruminococcus bicirculans (ex Wegman et al. 2014) TaxID=1160721 RepID=UPI00307B7CE7
MEVTRQAFYDHLSHKNAPWKYQALADEMMKIHEEDQFDLMPLGIATEDNMRVSLCCHTLENANKSYPDIKGCIIHSDRGSQYTSEEYRAAVKKYGIIQSMNSAGGRCHDNARCESMWARIKEELFYSREDKPENYTMKDLKTMIWRYYSNNVNITIHLLAHSHILP